MAKRRNPLDKPVLRDTTLTSGRDMLGRLLVLVQVSALIIGILLVLHGATRGQTGNLVLGILLLALVAGLIPVRKRWFPAAPSFAPPPPPVVENKLQASPAADAPLRVDGRRPRILLLNASLDGATGNTATALAHLAAHLEPQADLARVTLAAQPDLAKFWPLLDASDALVIGTDTHWDGWSSHLQTLLEAATPHEGTSHFLGKPAACVVTEHGVGGKAVLSRLQGVLVTLGCALPPMSGLVLSRSALLAAALEPAAPASFGRPPPRPAAAPNRRPAPPAAEDRAYTAWPLDRRDPHHRWLG